MQNCKNRLLSSLRYKNKDVYQISYRDIGKVINYYVKILKV